MDNQKIAPIFDIVSDRDDVLAQGNRMAGFIQGKKEDLRFLEEVIKLLNGKRYLSQKDLIEILEGFKTNLQNDVANASEIVLDGKIQEEKFNTALKDGLIDMLDAAEQEAQKGQQ